jgi:glycosyltransferase 2 family protein
MTSKSAGAIARFVVKAAISAALIAFALRNIDVAVIGAQLAAADLRLVVVAVLLITSIAMLHAERWRLVLRRLQCELAFAQTLRYVLIGYFFNQTLPSTVGGDAYRIWGVYRDGVGISDAASSVIIDRATALATLLLMIATGLPWLFELITDPAARCIAVLFVAGGIGAIVVSLGLGRFPGLFDRWRVGRIALALILRTRAVFLDARALVLATALTIGGYIVASYAVHLLARAISIDLGFGHSLLLVPLITLITVLPISIGGWGLRENTMVVALGLIGIPATAALSLSILYGLVIMASGIPGGLAWLAMRRRQGDIVTVDLKDALKG